MRFADLGAGVRFRAIRGDGRPSATLFQKADDDGARRVGTNGELQSFVGFDRDAIVQPEVTP